MSVACCLLLALVPACQGEAVNDTEAPATGEQALTGQETTADSAPAGTVVAKSHLTEEKRAELLQAAMRSIPKANADKTLSPYFFVLSDDPSVDQMPLESTSAEVNIAGVIAEVQVTQVYKNDGDRVLEAVYIFPVSTRAAVYAMKMTVGERVIVAKIKKREEARADYEQARRQGRTASLLEQQRPNVFQMNVANILPGDEIKVEMSYTELLVPEDGIYEFVYPTVVGPRYSETKEAGAPDTEKWVKNPTLPAGEKPQTTFHLGLTVRAGMPVAKVSSPSHDVEVEFGDPRTAHVALKGDRHAGNRDFVIRYALAGNKIETGLLLYPGEKENFFLLMMEPPERVGKRDIVPREYVFIVDVSGSMHGFPLDTSKKLMRDLLGGMRRDDYFNVLLFASSAAVLSQKSLRATRNNIDRGLAFIGRQRGSGGTRLINGLHRALALPHTEGTSRIVVVITDGYVSVEKEAFELIREKLGEANLFAFGIGKSINRFLIEGMARAGMGEPLVILEPEGAGKKAAAFREYISAPLMQGIRLDFGDFEAYSVEPKAVPDLFAKRPVIAFGKYRGKPEGTIVVRGHVPGEKLEGRMRLEDANISEKNGALRYLWARHRIMQLGDMNKLVRGRDKELIDEVTRLGLAYNLMTEFTSFVAVDTVVRADGRKAETVRQPVPMPEGVTNRAVGGKSRKRSKSLLGRLGAGGAGRSASATTGAPPPRTAAPMEAVKREPRPVAKAKKPAREEAAGPALSRQDVMRQIARAKKRLKACYQKHVEAGAAGPGRVVLEVTIGTDGRVKKVRVLSGAGAKKAAFAKCLFAVLERMRFPAIARPQKITLPIVFQ